MKAGWKKCRLGDLSDVITKGTTPTSVGFQFTETGINFIKVESVTSDHRLNSARFAKIDSGCHAALKRSQIQENDILFSIAGALGRCAIADKDVLPANTNQALAIIRLSDLNQSTPEYVLYALQSSGIVDQIECDRAGSAQQNLSLKQVSDFQIPLPPLDEQRRIVAVLDKAFAGIATATAHAQKNLIKARILFEYAVQAAFAKSADQRAWAVHTVETAAAKHRGAVRTGPFGSQLLHSEFVDEGIAVLGIDNAVSNEFRWDKLRFISPKKYEALSRYRVYPGDVIITIMGTCGRCAVIPADIPLAINTKHLCCITVDLKTCLPEFLHSYFLYHPVAQEYLGRTAKGSIMAGLNMGLIKEMPLHLPALEEQKRLVAVVAALREATEALAVNLEAKLTALTELKQSLLHKAFAGELT